MSTAVMSRAVMSPAEDTPLQDVKRTILQKFDVPDGECEIVIELIEVGPKTVVMGRHSHSGPEAGYLLEGDMTIEADGQPVQRAKAGQSWLVPADLVHVAKYGPAGAKGIVMWAIKKGKPFRSWA